ncbi:MAG: DUF1254 domain-containing protein [Ignavibacteria bacterium]|nr:DUF1254 domain-containing protein [Ignavibacteria bacterium]
MKSLTALLLITALIFASCGKKTEEGNKGSSDSKGLKDSLTFKTAEEAFLFAYPLVIMDLTRKKLTNSDTAGMRSAPINQFANMNVYPDYKFKDVVRPNADTYYSSAFLDLTADALVLSLPNTSGRYYLMPMLDAYTNVFSSPGKRTTGTEAGEYLITGPDWKGTVPSGIKEQIKAPTNLVWILGRFQVNGQTDGEKNVVPLQKKLKLTPLSSWGKEYTPPKGTIDPSVPKEDPNKIVLNMPIEEFFNYANKLMVSNPPFAADKGALEKFAKIGIAPGAKFELSKFDGPTQEAMKTIPNKVYAGFDKQLSKPEKLINGWNIVVKDIGTYGTAYAVRAFVTYVGLGANLPQDAIYPSNSLDQEGKPYNGSNKYILHFDKDKLPPVKAFWSLTMYDQDGYFIQNPINIYAVGHGAPFKYNTDGSLDIYIQNESPGKESENNWLPSPKGSFNLMLRLYWPEDTVINGNWTPPAVVKVK